MFKKAMTLLESARSLIGSGAAAEAQAQQYDTLSQEHEILMGDLAELQSEHEAQGIELERQTRVALEYFSVIEDMHEQREQWKSMFFQQSVSHQGGQALLTRALMLARKQLRAVCEVLVKKDEKGAEELFARLERFDAPPVGKADEFAAEMLTLAKGAQAQTDGFAERERIAAEQTKAEAEKNDE